ncbi:radical SAM protein [Ktedonosporobacter rubrisoli]|uniref:Radical SAM protein n=1 Tax=Ktedonosporobacter rubrisoli TaxID=2509675 RepID=A0A4P6JR60_KTERU|nr:radical SAM protein [Ktedonosporobacter rubrisoli]QBD77680.1 radical SAM protein [Ktedonosporobacter rubrisoli]
MRTSSYTIYVTIPDSEKVVIVNSLTGATDVVHEKVAEFLRAMRKAGDEQWVAHPTEQPVEGPKGPVSSPSEQTLLRLIRRGYLTNLSAEEEQQRLVDVVNVIHAGKMRFRSFLLVPTYDCNLRCSYCFQNDLRVKAENHFKLRSMTPERTDRIFEAIRDLQPEDEAHRSRRLGLYGGEPFLAENVQNIEYIVEKARSEGFDHIYAITNGTELQHHMNVMGPGGVTQLQITLDGPREAHNRSRIHKDGIGAGTFDKIMENIELLLPRGVKIDVRVNVTRINAPHLQGLAEIVQKRRLNTFSNFSIYATPVNYPSKTPPPEGFTPYQLDLFMAAKEGDGDNAMKLFERPATGVKGEFLKMFVNKTQIPPRSAFCASHSGMYLFDALGDIYTCWEWVGFPALRVGRIDFETGAVKYNNKQLERWHNRTIANVPTCRKCQYSLYCGGGCAVYATAQTGKFMNNHCNSYPAVFQKGVREAYLEYQSMENSDTALKQTSTATLSSDGGGMLCQ